MDEKLVNRPNEENVINSSVTNSLILVEKNSFPSCFFEQKKDLLDTGKNFDLVDSAVWNPVTLSLIWSKAE